MFRKGFFSGDKSQPCRVDGACSISQERRGIVLSDYDATADGLRAITAERVGEAMQVTEQNQMDGLEGRSALLQRLADALKKEPDFFGDQGRPGNMIGETTIYLEHHCSN